MIIRGTVGKIQIVLENLQFQLSILDEKQCKLIDRNCITAKSEIRKSEDLVFISDRFDELQKTVKTHSQSFDLRLNSVERRLSRFKKEIFNSLEQEKLQIRVLLDDFITQYEKIIRGSLKSSPNTRIMNDSGSDTIIGDLANEEQIIIQEKKKYPGDKKSIFKNYEK